VGFFGVGFLGGCTPKNPPGFLGTYPGVWTLCTKRVRCGCVASECTKAESMSVWAWAVTCQQCMHAQTVLTNSIPRSRCSTHHSLHQYHYHHHHHHHHRHWSCTTQRGPHRSETVRTNKQRMLHYEPFLRRRSKYNWIGQQFPTKWITSFVAANRHKKSTICQKDSNRLLGKSVTLKAVAEETT